jgi:GAF domain-containing protein
MSMSNIPSPDTVINPEETTRAFYKNWREGFATPLLIGALVFGLLALIPAVGSAQSSFIAVVFIVTYVMTGIVAFIKFPYWVKMWMFILIVYVLGLSELVTHGILGDGLFFFLAVIILATMMFSPKAGVTVTAVDTITFIVFGWFMLSGRLIPLNPNAPPAVLLDWLSAGAVVIMFASIIILGFQRLEQEFLHAQEQIDRSITALKDERNNLDNRVQLRTRQLRRVNEIGRTVTSILDPDELLARAVHMVGDEFDSYFTAIYLLDETGQWAELRDATGDAGKVLRENKHKVDANGKSSIATAIQTRQTRISLDTGTEPVRFDNPLLPYTRSQLIIPLIVRERIFGVLELHSTKENAFSVQDLDTYQNMANQIATAMDNSRLFREAQQSLTEMRATQRQYLQSAWSSLATEQKLEYELGDDESATEEIEIPLSLRDQIIGQISLASNEEWTPEQRNLIETIATQAALALENARLVEESQSIASRERLTNEIIAKIWASTTTEGILQTAAREIGRAVEAAEVEIELSMSDTNE